MEDHLLLSTADHSETMVWKNINSPSNILTPFNSKIGEFKIYASKKDMNPVMNKFYNIISPSNILTPLFQDWRI